GQVVRPHLAVGGCDDGAVLRQGRAAQHAAGQLLLPARLAAVQVERRHGAAGALEQRRVVADRAAGDDDRLAVDRRPAPPVDRQGRVPLLLAGLRVEAEQGAAALLLLVEERRRRQHLAVDDGDGRVDVPLLLALLPRQGGGGLGQVLVGRRDGERVVL